MKYQLETIPVYDAWASDAPCPLCTLMDAAEHRHVNYYLGNSVMNPETRVLVNETGFCSRHFPMMREAGHAHHLGLVGHTHLQTVRRKMAGKLKSLSRRASVKAAAVFSSAVRSQAVECLICRSMERDLKRYAYTAVIMYGEEDEFRGLFEESPGPCLIHAADLADIAVEMVEPRAEGRLLHPNRRTDGLGRISRACPQEERYHHRHIPPSHSALLDHGSRTVAENGRKGRPR